MYLRELRVVNDGPLEDIGIVFTPTPAGTPVPLIVVGENGSGKSNLLSIIADAIVEGASQHHSDVVAHASGVSRHWFRIVGGATLRRGTSGGFALLRFNADDDTLVYAEKAGTFPISALPDDLSPELSAGLSWPEEGSHKQFAISEEQSRRIYSTGCYAYFPASRSEKPHWLNEESLPTRPFNSALRFSGRLGKSLFIEQGLESLSQWIPGLLLDSRAVLTPAGLGAGAQWTVVGTEFVSHQTTLDLANRVLAIILDDATAHFRWTNRFGGLLHYSSRTSAALPLSTLSSGQATLLSIFGTVLMQCDASSQGAPLTSPGICVIDEVDAHVHVDLAFRAIPELFALFPLVQFIVSAHSPLFVLGMQARFGDGGISVTEMPSGRSIGAEGYGEFKNALDVLRVTQRFDAMIAERIDQDLSPLILCEGETDPRYIVKASEVLGRGAELSGIVVDWVGSRDARGGSQGAGCENLNRVWHLLTNNPEIASRPVLLLYDNDVKSIRDEDRGKVSRRLLSFNSNNGLVRAGIENLLLATAILDTDFETEQKTYPNGKTVTVRQLDKTRLCDRLCEGPQEASVFEAFSGLLDVIQEWRVSVSPRGDTHSQDLVAIQGAEAALVAVPESPSSAGTITE
ncbi:MAG: AAA family ATPase [Nigerium sp.]|nr:AAA family ATPase [Nigerium sp.]